MIATLQIPPHAAAGGRRPSDCSDQLDTQGGRRPNASGLRKAGLVVAVRASDLVSPLRNGTPLKAGDRSALVVAGTGKISTGEPAVFCKVVAVAPAQVSLSGPATCPVPAPAARSSPRSAPAAPATRP